MYRAWLPFLGLALFATIVGAAAGPVTTVRYRPPTGPDDVRFHYFVGMLDLAMRETRADYGDYKVVPAEIQISQKRAFQLVAAGRYLNVVWSMTSEEREKVALPIRIPLLKGLLGKRVLLVRRSQVAAFTSIATVRKLASFVGVQGADWPDTDILRSNGLQITASGDYEGMFQMVLKGHADYFPRSIAEVWDEARRFPKHALMISPSPLLVYDAPVYFFVNSRNRALAERIRVGLRRAIDDGSFERQFLSRKAIRKAIAFLKAGNYRILRLKNPVLPPQTPVYDNALWLRLPKNQYVSGRLR